MPGERFFSLMTYESAYKIPPIFLECEPVIATIMIWVEDTFKPIRSLATKEMYTQLKNLPLI